MYAAVFDRMLNSWMSTGVLFHRRLSAFASSGLADAVHVGEQDAGRLEVLDNLVERDGRSAERPEVDVRVEDGGLGLHGPVVAGRVSHPEGVQRQRLRLGGRHRLSRPAGVRRTALG